MVVVIVVTMAGIGGFIQGYVLFEQPSTISQIDAGIVGALQFVVMAAVILFVARRRLLAAFVVGGRRSSDDERAAALAALRSGHLPHEPRPRQAAVSYLRYQLGPAYNPRPVAVMSGIFAAGSVFLAFVYSPWCWLLAGAWAALAAVIIPRFVRVRRRARTLLMSLPPEPTAV
jgi:hypothetical protein